MLGADIQVLGAPVLRIEGVPAHPADRLAGRELPDATELDPFDEDTGPLSQVDIHQCLLEKLLDRASFDAIRHKKHGGHGDRDMPH